MTPQHILTSSSANGDDPVFQDAENRLGRRRLLDTRMTAVSWLNAGQTALGNSDMTTAETTIDTGTNELLCAIRERVAVITLNRPEARNALSDHLTPALRTMIRACGENPGVGALLITGAGTAFCAGGDVKGMGANRDRKKREMSLDEKVADLQERQRLLTGALISVRKPTIAALPGVPRSAPASPSRWPATSASPRSQRSFPPAICGWA
jgi:hypothetical protein